MNKEILNKMARMKLLGMHHAFQTSIETTRWKSLRMMNL